MPTIPTLDDWLESLRSLGAKPEHIRKIARALLGRAPWPTVEDERLPKRLRTALPEVRAFWTSLARMVSNHPGASGERLLLELSDGEWVESVLLPREGVCISTQIGCAVGCVFCMTGKSGLVRQLSDAEIVAQAVRAASLLGRRPDRIVFMGIGEPFANYENALWAARRMNAAEPAGLGIGARHITFSTCGVVPGIERFAREGMQFELSVSLHAPNNALRDRLMPVNRSWPLEKLIPACRAYTEQTGRIITFEYTLVAGFNDGPEQARELLRLLRPFPCRVNLIPLNPVPEFKGETPSAATCERFRVLLERGGLNATLRRSKGRGVNASCGQLRRAAVAATRRQAESSRG